jgi:hypothetical protein
MFISGVVLTISYIIIGKQELLASAIVKKHRSKEDILKDLCLFAMGQYKDTTSLLLCDDVVVTEEEENDIVEDKVIVEIEENIIQDKINKIEEDEDNV